MTPPSDSAAPVKAPTMNKTVGSAAGGGAGGFIGWFAVFLIHAYWIKDLSPETASAISAGATAVLGTLGTFFMPLITAAQQAALRKLGS